MLCTVIGPQRSGTNYLETLLRNNFENVRIQNQDSNHIWKHRVDPKDVKDKLNEKHKYFLIHKNPYKWIESLMKYNADLEKRQGGKAGEYEEKYKNKQDGDIIVEDRRKKKTNVGGALRLYNDLYHNWIDTDLVEVVVVRYEDLLIPQKRDKILQSMVDDHGFKKKRAKGGWDIPNKVGQSDKWDEDKTKQYLDLQHFNKLNQEHLDLVNKYVDAKLMEKFRYPIVRQKGWDINKRKK